MKFNVILKKKEKENKMFFVKRRHNGDMCNIPYVQ